MAGLLDAAGLSSGSDSLAKIVTVIAAIRLRRLTSRTTKTKDVDGRVKPGHDDPYRGVRIFVAENTPRRVAFELDVI
jgi:hypothetical protein